MTRTVRLIHNRVSLALHHLREGDGRPLLILHGLGERAPAAVPAWASAWTGPVAALDFTGHGDSTVPRSGSFLPRRNSTRQIAISGTTSRAPERRKGGNQSLAVQKPSRDWTAPIARPPQRVMMIDWSRPMSAAPSDATTRPT